MKDSGLLIVGAALFAALSLNAEARLYKWVDKNGQTHYGETIPPEYAGSDTKTLEKGHIKDRNDSFGRQQADPAESASAKAALESRRRDSALLQTYSNEAEIDLARDRNLQQVEARITSHTVLLNSAKDSLEKLYKERDDLQKQNRNIPPSLTEDIAETEALVAKRQKDLDASIRQKEEVRAKYEADKQRYRELTGR